MNNMNSTPSINSRSGSEDPSGSRTTGRVNSSQVKKLIITTLIISLSLILAACMHKDQNGEELPPPRFETDVILDITEKTGEEINVQPGDIIKFTLTGTNGEGRQWGGRPLEGDQILELDSHTTENFVPMKKGENFYSYWTFYIEKEGRAGLKFYYETPIHGEEPTDTFEVTIISTKQE